MNVCCNSKHVSQWIIMCVFKTWIKVVFLQSAIWLASSWKYTFTFYICYNLHVFRFVIHPLSQNVENTSLHSLFQHVAIKNYNSIILITLCFIDCSLSTFIKCFHMVYRLIRIFLSVNNTHDLITMCFHILSY